MWISWSESKAFTINDNSVFNRTRAKTKKGQMYALEFQWPLNMAQYFSSFSNNKSWGGAFFFNKEVYYLPLKNWSYCINTLFQCVNIDHNLKLDNLAIFYFQTTYTFDKIVPIIFYIISNLLKWKSLTWIVKFTHCNFFTAIKPILNLINCILCLLQFVMIWIVILLDADSSMFLFC